MSKTRSDKPNARNDGSKITPADDTVNKQQNIQREQDERDREKRKTHDEQNKPDTDSEDKDNGPHGSGKKHAVQAGHREQPAPPMPAQHLRNPGREADMQLKPRFEAPDYKGSGKLYGMVALVTGGDSGIGRAVAVLMAREGADVGIVYLAEHEDAQETRRCVEAEGTRCHLMAGDVKQPAFCQDAVRQTVAKFGKLDILVNNAAFQQHAESIAELSEERFDETMKTNVYGYFHMAKAAVPHLKRGASIINTGSVTGLAGSKELLDYSMTKGAIHAFTKSLAANLMDQGIRVNAVAPGPVWTPLNPSDRAGDEVAKFGADTDMHRPAQPEEISPAYVFLAAPCCASYISGIVLPITGSVGGG